MKKTSKRNIVLVWGFVGLFGIVLTIISDFILLGRPGNGYQFFELGTESMANLAPWRITIGTFVGVLALPIQTLGIVPVYNCLKPSGRVMPLIYAITSTHALLMGVAFHMSYAFIGSAWKLYYGNKISFDILDRFDYYWRILIIIMLVELIFCSIIYVLIVIRGKSLFSKWMAILNPLVVVTFALLLTVALPAPIGGFIAPACLNISTMITVGIAMIVIHKKSKNNEV